MIRSLVRNGGKAFEDVLAKVRISAGKVIEEGVYRHAGAGKTAVGVPPRISGSILMGLVATAF